MSSNDDKLISFMAAEYESGGSGGDDCPDENTWAVLETGLLDPGGRDSLLAHARSCSSCRRRTSEVITDWDDGISIPASADVAPRSLIFRLQPRHYALAAAVAIVVMAGFYLTTLERPTSGPTIATMSIDDVPQLRRLTYSPLIGIVKRHTLSTEPMPDAEAFDSLADDLQAKTQQDPGSAVHWFRLGRVRWLQADYPAAVNAFATAIQLDPNNATYHGAMATTLYYQKKFAPALLSVDRAITLDSSCVDCLVNRALILEALGRLKDAVACWQQVLELAPGDHDAAEIRQWLTIINPDPKTSEGGP